MACDVFKVLGIDTNRLLVNYNHNKDDLELYLLNKNVI